MVVQNQIQLGVVFLRKGVDDSQPEIVLAAKVMVERPFGYTGGGQHGIDARRAEAFLTNQVGAGVDDVIAGVVRCHGWYIRPVV